MMKTRQWNMKKKKKFVRMNKMLLKSLAQVNIHA
jgi:hypothetical protein